ncbi:hypothetical protein H0H81_006041, partial [Sphagnurus paluster]
AVRDGKCQRNHEGRIVLPSGAFVPSNTPGDNIKAKIDEWHRRNPGQLAAGRMTANAGTMLYEVNQVLSYDAPPPPPPAISAEEQIRLLQQEVLALRSGRKMAFDGVNVPRAPPAPRQPAAQPAPPAPPAPTASASRPPAPAPAAAPAPAPAAARSSNAPNAADKGKGRADAPAPAPNREAAQGGAAREDPIHPYANTGGNRYVPPNTRNLGAPPDRPRADPAYRTFAPIVDPLKSGAVFDRVLGSNVTVSVEELCSIAPEIRGKFREAVTQKRVATTMIEVEPETVDEIHSPAYIEELEAVPSQAPRSNVAEDYYDIYLRSLAPGETPERLTVAKETRSLRSIFMNIDTMEQVECIVDSGSQIVAMSEEVCHELKIKYDPSVILNMQSANGCLDPSLGLARNVPCTIGDLTLYLQIHVIRNPAYDILLGRPFDVLTSSNVKTYPDGNTVVTITDPNSGDVLAIPTFARGEHRRPTEAANFRMKRA